MNDRGPVRYWKLCVQCERDFEAKKPHAICCSDQCRLQHWIEEQVKAAEIIAERVTRHPLAGARAEQEATDLKSKFSQIIYQGIVDRLKFGPVHADDLEGLFPEERRTMCRRLVGAQFGSLASRGYIVERERRKSKVPSRKAAKSGVYILTKKGRETLVGMGGGAGGRTGIPTASHSGEETGAGVPVPQGQGEAAESVSSRASAEPARLFGDAPPSAYDPFSEAA